MRIVFHTTNKYTIIYYHILSTVGDLKLDGYYCRALQYTPPWETGKPATTLEPEIVNLRALIGNLRLHFINYILS
jgi:hypothetical protein